MPVKCSAGYWDLNPETGAISSIDDPHLIAVVSGLIAPNKDIEKCISNAAVMTQSAEMYSLLIFIKSALQTMYRAVPDSKGRIWEYVELRIRQIEENVEEIINNRPGK